MMFLVSCNHIALTTANQSVQWKRNHSQVYKDVFGERC